MVNFYEMVAVLAGENWSWGLPALAIATLMAAALIFCNSWRWRAKKTKAAPLPLPPSPPGLPILGNLPFLRPDLHRYFSELSKTYGPIIKLQLGRKICIVISSPSIAKQVLKDHDAIFANRDTPAAVLNMKGTYARLDIMWRPNSDEFRRLRKLVISEILSKTSLDACYQLRRGEIRRLVNDIHGEVGSSVNIGEKLVLTSINVMVRTLWGGSLDGDEGSRFRIDELKQRSDEFIRWTGAPNVSDFFPILTPLDLQGLQSKSKKHLLWLYEFFDSVIESRTKAGQGNKKEGNDNSKDFLQKLLELNQRGNDETSMSMVQAKSLLLNMLLGGVDTIPTTVEWAMTELLRHPDKMSKLLHELDTVVGKDNTVEESHLPKLLYLEAVGKEALRLHPPAPLLLPHMPTATTVVGGYTIPKHSRIFVNAWAIQRDPEIWEDPLEFKPERFLKDGLTEKLGNNNYRGNDFHYFPFGAGRRMCVGMSMAEKMVPMLIGTLVHSFEWEWVDGVKPDAEEKCGVILKKLNPLVAIAAAARLPSPEQYK